MRELEAWTLGYLVNALWQVPLVFGAAWVMTRLTRAAETGLQHTIWVAALLVEAALPACPVQLGRAARGLWSMLWIWRASSTARIRVDIGTALAGGTGRHQLPAGLLTMLLLAYGLSVVYFAARLAFGLWRTYAMAERSEPLTLPGLTTRKLPVHTSREIAGPVTVGLWHGLVLLPDGYVGHVTDEDLRAVLAHEGAHVERRDFLKNALYAVLTLPIAFHPMLWLTRRRVAESREMVCDAMAAEVVSGRVCYAESLLRLASLQVQRTPNKMLHAIGIFGLLDANSFERRLMHLTTNRREMKGARRIVTAVACGVLGLGTCATALALRMGVPMQQSEGVSQATGGDSRIARVSGGVMAGNVVSKVNPTYPPDAKAEGISGSVVLSAVIGTDGTIENLQVVSGPEKLRSSALTAVRQWTYKPYILNGVPVSVQTTITVNYSFGQ